MTARQREIIEQSWQIITEDVSDPGGIFYDRLFEIAPSLRKLFTSDMKAQSHKVIESIEHVIKNIDDNEMVVHLRKLGAGHNKYKVKPAHYNIVGEALFWTVKKILGEKWNEEVNQAWIELYNIISTEMKDAAIAAK